VGDAGAGRADASATLIASVWAGLAATCATWCRCLARRARAAFFAGAAGAAVVATGAAAAPYIDVPVAWTTPGLIVMPSTVAWWPSESVSRTVNGPGPAPEEASQ
jgi:hypothetical protein